MKNEFLPCRGATSLHHPVDYSQGCKFMRKPTRQCFYVTLKRYFLRMWYPVFQFPLVLFFSITLTVSLLEHHKLGFIWGKGDMSFLLLGVQICASLSLSFSMAASCSLDSYLKVVTIVTAMRDIQLTGLFERPKGTCYQDVNKSSRRSNIKYPFWIFDNFKSKLPASMSFMVVKVSSKTMMRRYCG